MQVLRPTIPAVSFSWPQLAFSIGNSRIRQPTLSIPKGCALQNSWCLLNRVSSWWHIVPALAISRGGQTGSGSVSSHVLKAVILTRARTFHVHGVSTLRVVWRWLSSSCQGARGTTSALVRDRLPCLTLVDTGFQIDSLLRHESRACWSGRAGIS